MDETSKKLVERKIKTAEQLSKIIGPRPRQKKVIMCHGTFDVVHPGHVRHLLYAKTKGDILIASLTADEHIMKANSRPYVPEDLRAINLAALEVVDYVIIDRRPTPLYNLELIKPDYFAKGYEYSSGGINPKTQEELAVLETYGGEIIFTPGDIVYSSSALIELAPPKIATEKLLSLMTAEDITFSNLYATLNKFEGIKVHVVGDTIVDSYTYCDMIGGMTKTPTMSVLFQKKVDYSGGAAIIAKHLKAAGADVTFSTVLGEDAFKNYVLDDLEKAGVNILPIVDETRPTTNKNAIIVKGYRLLKVDTLDNRSISDKTVKRLKEQISSIKSDAVVFSDFRHGVFNRHTIPELAAAIPEGAYRVADSQVASRWGNILEFEGFDLITPNEREARFALGDQDSVVRPLALELYRRSKCKTLILKLGERGTITYRSSREPGDYRAFFAIDSFVEQVVDAVGAGDAMLAYATLAMIATKNEVVASILGCMAAGVECEHDGNWPVMSEAVKKKIHRVETHTLYRYDGE
ncbi:MAG: ADP-heptose synthase [Deltaproteobacteria bacterium CG_4_10_14_0_2_um_filter_43_8]|nr:MAG: ADP-heptose synthase [Deltaproteobacteria bacterium CG11_big_fil_rev_8_21_14_0_20_42_23]PJA21722.1 MAG: ADP-heptose synthase [Deltaproteobacteria bacterium CG_4_10_14_0_2_um_filter_43_8]PJC64571.1 MAG: ADP-heptose synthase [Deltaproteobacteria bacterium CG_4_9_14_0_2_um_filter_42_21]